MYVRATERILLMEMVEEENILILGVRKNLCIGVSQYLMTYTFHFKL